MSTNIWDLQQSVNNNIDRHSFDWSHINHFTAKFGYYYPVLSQLLPANSKWECNPYLGMQLMPMQFPVQTPMKARMSFFKVPLRILWKDYRDYISNFRDDLEEPYHDIPYQQFDDFYGKCQLGEYNDIPNVVYGQTSSYPLLTLEQPETNPYRFGIFVNSNRNIDFQPGSVFADVASVPSKPLVTSTISGKQQIAFTKYIKYEIGSVKFTDNDYSVSYENIPSHYEYNNFSNLVKSSSDDIFEFGMHVVLTDSTNKVVASLTTAFNNAQIGYTRINDPMTGEYYYQSVKVDLPNLTTSQLLDLTDLTDEQLQSVQYVYYIPTLYIDNDVVDYNTGMLTSVTLRSSEFLNNVIPFVYYKNREPNYRYITYLDSPYYSSDYNPNGLKLSAYRARAYECIYNSYFRDARNNPLVIDGKEVYNSWLPNYEGGADRYVYKLRRANWEKDFLTTAVRQPQQGKQPLVGLTQYVDSVDANNPNGLSYKLALVDENGNKYQIKYVVDDTATGQPSVEVGDILPDNTQVDAIDFTKMLNATNYGISIPDFRIVNAYQKFLELNLRKGYSYKDIIEGRFDCKVRYDDLLMPEYIGGFTREINMNRVVQSIDINAFGYFDTDPSGYNGSLGALSGDAFLSTDSVPRIDCFCDEESLIIGILSVVPTPSYTQLIPRDYFYRDLLDHFQPEFANLGYQPITYKEICPLQCEAFGVSQDDTFGYQRSWYEYVQKTDTVHGLLRSNLRNFIMNRNFESVPRLTEDFLLVDPNQLNDVFQVTEDTDKIVGQCKFDIKVELPIPRVSIPRLD